MGIFASAARVVHVLLVGTWLGAGILSVLLIYLVPDTLASRQAAEAVLSATRARVDLFGLAAGPIALLTLGAGWLPLNVPLRRRVMLALVATGAAAFSGRYLVPKMREVIAAMGRPLEDLPLADPLVVEYLDLSAVSVAVLAVQVAAAFLLVVMAVAAAKPKRTYGIEL